MTTRGMRRFVEDLLRGRRTKPFPASEDEAAELRTAIMLRTARPGSGAPSEEFLSDLHRRLAAELDDEPIVTGNLATDTPAAGKTRRRFIQGASIAAAAAAGAVGEHTLTGTSTSRTGPNTRQADSSLTPKDGAWRTVAASSEVTEEATRAFDLGSVTGFVHRSNGQVRAVSGICTHQGCQLMLNAPARQLDCPCHNTSFSVTGELLNYQMPVAPRPLPQLAVRELDGAIQIYAPPAR